MDILRRGLPYVTAVALTASPLIANADEAEKANAFFLGIFPGVTALLAPAELGDIFGNGFSYGAKVGWIPNAYLWPSISVIKIGHGGKNGLDAELRTLKTYASLGAGFSRADKSDDIIYFESGTGVASVNVEGQKETGVLLNIGLGYKHFFGNQTFFVDVKTGAERIFTGDPLDNIYVLVSFNTSVLRLGRFDFNKRLEERANSPLIRR